MFDTRPDLLPKSSLLHLESLKLRSFKNYEQASLACSPTLNGFTGLNGMGKTNLLDAVYYLCMGKSHFNLPDSSLNRHGSSFFRVEGMFRSGERTEHIVVKVEARKSKEVLRNGVPYERLSDHVGLIPVVFIAPDDTVLVREGSEERRRFLDNTLSQVDPVYLRELITYQRLLRQRNAMLKQSAAKGQFDPALIDVFDQQMGPPAAYIYEQRQAFLERFMPLLKANVAALSGRKEEVSCRFRSHQQEGELLSLLRDAREKDKALERTTVGPHKDDLVFDLYGYPLKKFGSQGQVKTYVLALKLAQYELLRQEKGKPPLLLLDDIFDKLDRKRVEQLLQLLTERRFGQLFITDTHRDRLREIMGKVDPTYRIFTVTDGTVEQENPDEHEAQIK